MRMECEMHLRFPIARGLQGLVGSQEKSWSCSRSSNTPSSCNPSKQFLSGQAGGFGKACGLQILYGACHFDEGGFLTMLGLGLGLGLRRVNQGPQSANSTVGRLGSTVFLTVRTALKEMSSTTTTPTSRGGDVYRRQLSAA